eukprot:TRINITY_DN7877_c0_g1_i2.p1 TRINITY_DN7877_c0_g1~~TRINITY_DN7877_c0_g1_i2.p1  ORF type:complete len:579 (-),score=100.76 TRINITY_DN7877_c0_g1_i2:726-2291(-)
MHVLNHEAVKCEELCVLQHISELPTSSDVHGAHGLPTLSSPSSGELSLFSQCLDSDADNSADELDGEIGSSTEHDDLYEILAGCKDAVVLFGWWPKASRWRYAELCERTTRCLPAVRSGVDLVALPDVPEVREFYSVWAEQHSLAPWQAIWFAPRVGASHELSGDDERPRLACQEVFAQIPAEVMATKSSKTLCFYPMYLVPDVQKVAEQHGVKVLGDENEHQLGLLSNAKAWLHPHIDEQKRALAANLRDSAVQGSGARGPRGYIASSTEDLLKAFRALKAEMPNGRLVLKPSWASGGEGIIIDVAEEQLRDFSFPKGNHYLDYTAVLEEFIEGRGSSQSPTLYMIGSKPCGTLADQVLSGDGVVVYEGGKYSSALPQAVTQACVAAAKSIQEVWCLSSHWSLDYVLDKEGTPIVVDLNMGRPSANFAVRLWESKMRQRLCVRSAKWVVPQGLTARSCYAALERSGLLWSDEALRGALIYQFLPGQKCSFAVASSRGWKDVEEMIEKFIAITTKLGELVV